MQRDQSSGNPSLPALEAATEAIERGPDLRKGYWGASVAAAAVAAAHDPALGLDRSVCLRDVVQWLLDDHEPGLAADIETEFGGDS